MGTLEELFEMVTWSQLGIHAKPIGLYNVDGFWDGLVSFVGHLQEEGFVRAQHAALLHIERDPALLVRRLREAAPPAVEPGLTP
jgi:uncharacterized protein (TIGR00730 family)